MTDIRSHFGFSMTPFTPEIPVGKRFCHPVFDEPLADLERTVSERMSAAVISPAGTGKTMLLRTLESRLPQSRYKVHYVKTSDLGKRDMYREIALATGCSPQGQCGTIMHRIEQRLLESVDTNGVRPVIILDDAHELTPAVLGVLKFLTNYEMDSRLVVSFILVGHKPLATLLDMLEDIGKRLAHYATLRNLTRDEIRKYVAHRLAVAGARADLFDDGAHDAMFEIGGGNLRATDRLALKSLQIAADDDAKAVGSQHVAIARQKLWP
ncbi:MAG: ral secretion pathway protein [Actinomycetota bacterium]|nr:ral secretion pathway protein [Actinomycetota bacterium]